MTRRSSSGADRCCGAYRSNVENTTIHSSGARARTTASRRRHELARIAQGVGGHEGHHHAEGVREGEPDGDVAVAAQRAAASRDRRRLGLRSGAGPRRPGPVRAPWRCSRRRQERWCRRFGPACAHPTPSTRRWRLATRAAHAGGTRARQQRRPLVVGCPPSVRAWTTGSRGVSTSMGRTELNRFSDSAATGRRRSPAIPSDRPGSPRPRRGRTWRTRSTTRSSDRCR